MTNTIDLRPGFCRQMAGSFASLLPPLSLLLSMTTSATIACLIVYEGSFSLEQALRTWGIGTVLILAFLSVACLTRSPALGGLVVPVLTVLSPMSLALQYAMFLLAGVGVFLVALHGTILLRLARTVTVSHWARVLLSLLAFTLLCLLVPRYAGPWFTNAFNDGTVHKDTLFHASIAAMYKNYGIPSTGLCGLVPVRYYTFSHQFYAGVSAMSGLSVLEVYSCFHYVVGSALYALLACLLGRTFHRSTYSSVLLAMCLLLLLYYSHTPLPTWVRRARVHAGQFWSSESYTFGLCFLFSSLTCLKHGLGKAPRWWFIWASMAFLLLSLFSKASVGLAGGLIFLAMFGIRFRRSATYIVSLLVLLSCMCIWYWSVLSKPRPIGPHFLHYIRHYVRLSASMPVKILFFLAAHFAVTWCVLAWGFIRRRRAYMTSIECLSLLCLLLPACMAFLVMAAPGGSAYYFTSIPEMVAIALAGSILASRLPVYLRALAQPLWRARWAVTTLLLSAFVLLNLGELRHRPRPHFQGPRETLSRLNDRLLEIRDSSPLTTRIHLEGHKALIRNMPPLCGYFYVQAVSERPLAGTILKQAPVNDIAIYGMSSYHDLTDCSVPPTITVELSPQVEGLSDPSAAE